MRGVSLPPTSPREARHPALLFANGIGDHFVSLPAIRALAHIFSERLMLICESGARSIFFPEIPLRSIHEIPITIARGTRQFDADRVAVALQPCDLLISLNPWHSASMDRLLENLGPCPSIGFHPKFGQRIALDFTKHSVDLAFDIPRAIDQAVKLDDFVSPPQFAPRFIGQARRIRQSLPNGFRVLAIHADTAKAKMWPPRRFVKLLDLFLHQHPDFLALVLGWTETALDTGRLGHRVIPACRLPLPTSARLVGLCDLFVGIDSCLLHAADLFRVPGVGIFGPTNPDEWGFKFAPHRHVRASTTLASLDEKAVLDALVDLLAATAAQRVQAANG
jgi:ADP-heptose:LPS heptosyltransferase